MNVYGKIIEAKGEKVLPEAKVTLFVGDIELAQLYSDKNGQFKHKESDSYIGQTLTCMVEKKGYDTQKGTFVIDDEVVKLELELVPVGAGPKKEPAKKKSKKWLFIGIGAAALLVIIAVVLFLVIPPGPKVLPEIISFEAQPDTVLQGKKTTLSWETKGTANVLLDEEAVEATGSKEVSPMEATTYTLIAKGDGQEDVTQTCSVEVTIPKPPQVVFFTSNPGTIKKGNSSLLKWETQEATTVRLGIEKVEPTGEKEVFPTDTTTYTLTAKNDFDKKSERCSVSVITPQSPDISTFTVTPKIVRKGESATIEWNTSNAKIVRLDPKIGRVGVSGSEVIIPKESTTYTLSAQNDEGEIRKEVRVEFETVPPVIDFFSVNPVIVRRGQSATLKWKVSGASGVSIHPLSKSVETVGSRTLKPPRSTAYTLIASNKDGSVRKTVTVNVVAGPSPVIYTSGRVTIRGTWSCDLDLGKQTSAGSDFWWQQVNKITRYLVPKNGAKFSVLGKRNFNTITYSYLKKLRYRPSKINGSATKANAITTGTVVAAITNQGRYCKFKIESYGYNLTISWVTYQTTLFKTPIKTLTINPNLLKTVKKK